MKNATAAFYVLVTLSFSAYAAAPPGKAIDNPIVGTWTRTLPDGCKEKHTFLASGLVSGTSGAEYDEEKFSIVAMPDHNGFYKLAGVTLKNTGGPNCGGSSEDRTGKEWMNYILFSKDRAKHFACSEPDINTCWGPFIRLND